MTRPCSIQNKPIVGLLVGSWWLGEWLKCIWEESTLDLLNLQCINNLLPTVLHCEPLVVTSHYLWWRLGLVFVTSWQARDGVHWPDSLARRLSHWNAILQNWYKAQNNTIVFLRESSFKIASRYFQPTPFHPNRKAKEKTKNFINYGHFKMISREQTQISSSSNLHHLINHLAIYPSILILMFSRT